MASDNADSESINLQLADFLCDRQEEIVRAWMGRVQADARVAAESLTTNELRNHIPRLLDDLAALLRKFGSDDATARVEKDAAKHGIERWEQGFDAIELLREIAHLRGVLIYHLRIF